LNLLNAAFNRLERVERGIQHPGGGDAGPRGPARAAQMW
jgi:hypothetical protein